MIINFMPSYFWVALGSGLLLSVVAGPLGSLLLWQKRAYFGDSLAHAALLGVAISLIWSMPLSVGMLVLAVLMGLSLVWLEARRLLGADAILGLLSHGALALALLLISLLDSSQINLLGLLYGDILAGSTRDLVAIALIAAISSCGLFFWRREIILLTLHQDLASSEGIPVRGLQLVQTVFTAAYIALALKLVGALLIVALLIIPAAAARSLARTPTMMMLWAAIIGMISVAIGLSFSFSVDTPAGPSIVLAALVLFVLTLFKR